MRRVLSVVLLIAVAAGAGAGVWFWHEPVTDFVSAWCMKEEQSWIDKPAITVGIRLTGADLNALEPLAKKISSYLQPFDGHSRSTSQDSPAPQIDLAATVPPAALLPLRELAQKTVEGWPSGAGRSAAGPDRALVLKRAKVRGGATRRARPSPAVDQKLRDVRRRRDALMKAWVESEKTHSRSAVSHQEIRHPDDLLSDDPEAQALKKKLIDLEMTLAEVIDHYTLAHPRVRDLQSDIAAVRSSLDRRVMVAESDVEARQSRRQAEFQQKKKMLDREEKRLMAALTAAPAEPPQDEPPETAAPAIQRRTGVRMDWSDTPTSVRELVMQKHIDAGKLSEGLAGLGVSAILVGYLLGAFGFYGPAGSSSGDKPAAPAPSPAAEKLERIRAAAPPAEPKPRKTLPPISETPAPPAPEKIIDDTELPGEPWVSMPLLPDVEKGLYTVFAPTSAAAAFFSKTADALLTRLPNSDGSQVVSVASVRSGAGTSTFLANLAVALAPRRPVLLMDFHHTAPSLHTFFPAAAASQDIMSSVPWAESVLPTPVDRLSLLPMFSPHLEKEMAELKLKKRLQAFLKENPVNRLVLLDVPPLGRSDLFDDLAEASDLFLLLLGPEPAPASDKAVLKRLEKNMKKKSILRVTRTAQAMAAALASRPPAEFEFA